MSGIHQTARMRAIYSANVISLLHLNGVNGSSVFTDETGRVWFKQGSASIGTAESKFGGASLSIGGGTTNNIATDDTADFDFSSGIDYTIECFFRPNANQDGSAIITTDRSGSGAVHFAIGFCNGTVGSATGNQLFFGFFTGSTWIGCVNPSTLTNGQWYHIAATRRGTRYSLWVDGAEVAFVNSSASNPTRGTRVSIGRRWELTLAKSVNGWIDEVRVTKGVARYTGTFTPPTAEFPNP